MSASVSQSSLVSSFAPRQTERRLFERQNSVGHLWLIDHEGGTVLRCQCTDVSDAGARLRVPLGYGITSGQRFELRAHMPGHNDPTDILPFRQRWASVVRTRIQTHDGEAFLDVGVVLDDSTFGAV